MNDPFNKLWMSYFIKTPWFSAESIGRLYKEFEKNRRDMENYNLRVSAIMPGKTRAFFIEPSKVTAMKKIFSIQDDEEIILAENANSIQKLIDAMKAAQDKKIFFIMTKKFLNEKFPFERLVKANFVHGKNFLKGWDFLKDSNGEPFDTYSLVQAM